MSLLILEAVWLLALGAIHLILRREFDILTARAKLAGRSTTDGLEVGSPVPRSLPHLDRPLSHLDSAVLLFLFDDCEPCIALAAELASSGESRPYLRVFVVPPPVSQTVPRGSGEGERERLIEGLLQSRFQIESDEGARRIAEVLKVRSGPFAMVVKGGLVVAKSQVAGPATVDGLARILVRSESSGQSAHGLESIG